MKIIEAMKKIKDLQRKAEDLREKIKNHSADMDFETPIYENQRQQVRDWIQAHTDIVQEIMRLRVAIQRTNLATRIKVELGETVVEKSVAEWVHRRRDLAQLDLACWSAMTKDRLLKEGTVTQSNGEKREVKIRRYYDPAERDKRTAVYASEPTTIDATLEVANAVTELIEA